MGQVRRGTILISPGWRDRSPAIGCDACVMAPPAVWIDVVARADRFGYCRHESLGIMVEQCYLKAVVVSQGVNEGQVRREPPAPLLLGRSAGQNVSSKRPIKRCER